MTEAFVRTIEHFVGSEGIDLVAFEKGQRKDEVTQRYLRRFTKSEGVLYVGNTHKQFLLREHLAPLLGQKPSQLTPGRITYDLRRLRLHALIERIEKTHRYRITAKGLRTARLPHPAL